jgi:hypothetical protein
MFCLGAKTERYNQASFTVYITPLENLTYHKVKDKVLILFALTWIFTHNKQVVLSLI